MKYLPHKSKHAAKIIAAAKEFAGNAESERERVTVDKERGKLFEEMKARAK